MLRGVLVCRANKLAFNKKEAGIISINTCILLRYKQQKQLNNLRYIDVPALYSR